MSEDAFASRVSRLGALADPIRWRLYRYVCGAEDAVSREQAADAVEVPHHTAKFHLERLVEAGLLVTEFRRLTGRSGPGAGRPAKLYRRARKEVAVSVPARRYDLAGQVLADAVEQALDGFPMRVALEQAAAERGRTAAGAVTPKGRGLERVAAALDRLGYEPRVEEQLSLGNCPFERLAADHPELVCGVNRTFVSAVTEGVGCENAEVTQVRSGPHSGGCCVRVALRPLG